MTKKFLIAFFFLCCLTNQQVADTLSISDVNFNKDVTCLAKNMYHEASGESTEGKTAVTQVVLNRTRDSHFPGGICEVVYEKHGKIHQFSWTSDPNKKITDNEVWQECLHIARMALSQPYIHRKLAQSNALFYHATYIKTNWHKKNIITKIGNHIFYAKL